ncbi:PAS domain-containing hybrid sensor histidine kinase/response regulator [Ramlibacter sp. AN1133]|uniref:PAS domain-containing hybrid sensor histidine kinase/response regulator n=1 Tax=Ramlibacter sp. AN1133 TaxID=3133429 RepID=UPI0030C0103F
MQDAGWTEAAEWAELVPVALIGLDAEGRLVNANGHWNSLAGRCGEKLLHLPWVAAVHPKMRWEIDAAWKAAAAQEESFVTCFRACGRPGSQPWVRIRISPLVPPRGATAFIGAAVDASEGVRFKQELETSNQRLARAVDAAGLGLWEVDLRRREVYLCSGWAKLVGFARQDRVIRLAELLPHIEQCEDTQAIGAAWNRLLTGAADRVALEHRIRRAPDGVVWLYTQAQVSERAADGRPLRIHGTCKDVSERRRSEGALRSALAAADKANRAKREFLASMSHEIRTPLNGVVGLTRLLAQGTLAPAELDAVSMIDSCAKALLGLVDNILDFSQIEAGRLALHPVPTDLRRLLGEIGDVVAVQARQKGLIFHLGLDPDLPPCVRLDPGRVRQVLLNLLANALKFTSHGGFSLSARIARGAMSSHLFLQVTDTGIGIAATDQASLFMPFTQVDASASKKYEGTGLGLAISRQLAQLMGGQLCLVSEPGRGSAFTLRLPLDVLEPCTLAAAPAPSDRNAGAILLVEDNEVNQIVARRMLESLGHQRVTVAGNGNEAIAACRSGPFDLILMDWHMPEKDGLQATREIRAMGLRTPIIALTASATCGDRERCLEAGMNDFLSKPVEMAVLAEKLRRWLRAEVPVPVHGSVANEPSCNSLPAFDRGTLGQSMDPDFETIAWSLRMFERQTGPALDALEQALHPGELERARSLSHRIRDGAGMLGAL